MKKIGHSNFQFNFVRISRQILEKSDVCRFFNQICEGQAPRIIELLNIIQSYSFVSLAAKDFCEEAWDMQFARAT